MKKNPLTALLLLFLSTMNGQAVSDSVHVNPNPFSQRSLITYTIVNNDTISIDVFNLVGALVLSPRTNFIVTAGLYQDSLIMDNFADGIYVLMLKNKQKILKTSKVVKATSMAIREQNGSLNPKIYPNPLKDEANIEFQAEVRGTLSIYDFLGQNVYSLNQLNKKQKIDLVHLPGGIYFLKIQASTAQMVFKLVKE